MQAAGGAQLRDAPHSAGLTHAESAGADQARAAEMPLGTCCAVLCCAAALRRAVPCCAVLCCAALRHAVLCCAVLCYVVLNCAVLCCAVPCCPLVHSRKHSCCGRLQDLQHMLPYSIYMLSHTLTHVNSVLQQPLTPQTTLLKAMSCIDSYGVTALEDALLTPGYQVNFLGLSKVIVTHHDCATAQAWSDG